MSEIDGMLRQWCRNLDNDFRGKYLKIPCVKAWQIFGAGTMVLIAALLLPSYEAFLADSLPLPWLQSWLSVSLCDRARRVWVTAVC